MGLIDKARKFTIEQRIEELEKAIARDPNHPSIYTRQSELEELKSELERYDE